MAESSVPLTQDQFICSICLDLLKNPVTISCGHCYCVSCISDCWDQEDQKRVYSCPQCRQTFTSRPVLGKNTMLAEVVEKLKKTKLQAARPAQCSSGSGDVECDVCTGDKNKAVKSCLVCLESYCQTHFERHEEFHSRKRHKVTDATGRLQEIICPQHEKLLEIFCRTDQCCICYLCTMDEHKNHETVSAAEEKTEKRRQLNEIQRTNQQKLEERQQDLEELRSAVESHKRSAQAAVEDTERIFTELICSIERSRSELTQLIKDQEKTLITQAEGLSERLEQEIEDLRRRDAELEQLSHTDHHIHFLQSFQSLSVPPGSTDSPRVTVSPYLYFDDAGKSVSDLRDKLEQFCREETEMIFNKVRNINIIPIPEPKTREEFLQYTHQIDLDPNTVNKNLILSDGNRVIEHTPTVLLYPDHPDRFDGFPQVLCRESVCGCFYWEVEWSRDVEISVAYKSISRKESDGKDNEEEEGKEEAEEEEVEIEEEEEEEEAEEEESVVVEEGEEKNDDENKDSSEISRFGCNDQSWSLYCTESSCSFWHSNNDTDLPVVSSSSRIGVYVDHGAGTLSFYSISDTMNLIHRVNTTFTQPLYPGFGVYDESFVKLCGVSK